jgi:hypothetical protein
MKDKHTEIIIRPVVRIVEPFRPIKREPKPVIMEPNSGSSKRVSNILNFFFNTEKEGFEPSKDYVR